VKARLRRQVHLSMENFTGRFLLRNAGCRHEEIKGNKRGQTLWMDEISQSYDENCLAHVRLTVPHMRVQQGVSGGVNGHAPARQITFAGPDS
jgi:hypothetical protein